ncbi:hypothetical protein [Streptomyces sp. CMB-StM0423]|uniref:hypothetical protein n=1 Tax=Streptomyces sp. CMB-StM0423 TaxID=2059884 RepID=UPI000C6FE875|nr:hypothetical protein [Streptomyces sp. CMB-StM0423]AUH40469.1 hypothetical protein CXR04_09560 [Streptomyces sp. CMB-StM0423]
MYLTTPPNAPLALQLCVTKQPTATRQAHGVGGAYDPARQVSVLPDGSPQADSTCSATITCRGGNDDLGVPNESETEDLC